MSEEAGLPTANSKLVSTANASARLATALTAPQQARRNKASHDRLGANRRRAPGAGRHPKLTLTDQITAALLHQHLGLPTAVLARLLRVSTDTARHGITEAQRLRGRLAEGTLEGRVRIS